MSNDNGASAATTGVEQIGCEALGLKEVLGLAGDLQLDAEEQIHVEVLKASLGDAVYVEALSVLAGVRPEPELAGARWQGLLDHRAQMERSLGRYVGIQTAALDFLYPPRSEDAQVVVVPRATYDAVVRDSRIDPKTGLSTQGSFRWSLDHELRRARRYKKNLVLVLVDLDGTGELNEARGPAFVDYVLREVAGLVRQNTRVTDVAARLDEDVFGILLPECKVADARALAERLRVCIEKQQFARSANEDPARITASIGISGYPRNANDAEALMTTCRETLYRAKEMGKNRVEFD